MTFQQFLKQGQAHGSFYYPEQPPPAPLTNHAQSVQVQPPAAEPVKMKAISAPLNSSLTAQATTTPAAAQTNSPLDLKGSDGRLEVLLPGDALDFSHAALSNGAAPGGGLTLQVSQLYGHYIGERNILGSYQIQVVDSQEQVVHNIRLRQPVTIRYHYQPWEMTDLALDSGQLMLSWPNLIVAARDAGQPTDNLEVPLTDDVQTHTLTAQTMVLGPGVVDVSGTSQIQSPPKPLLASVSGNAGQLSYGYPLSVAPGPDGFAPQLQLSYSSESTNERYSQRSPASSVGEGWSLSLGSISAENYPFGSTAGAGTWYFLSGVSNVSDRLIPAEGAGFYDTMHISHLRLQFDGNCFHIWDRSGYYYELGCTSDSLQYMTDAAHKRTNYLWDVDRIVAPYNSTSQIKEMFIHYLQDSVTTNGRTTIRDAGIKQIQYGYANALGNSPLKQVVGTVDFHYHAPNAQVPWADAYGTNYHCSTPPPRGKSTTLRCDDPIALGGNAPPNVMSTLTLDSVTSYVGSDSGSGSYPAYRYDFSYHDTFTTICYDPLTLVQEYCAATHQLTSIVPTVYQHGTAYKRKGVVLGYTRALHDTYYDPAHQTSDPKQEYGGATFWTYLNSFEDLDTGVGEKISYGTAYGNTNGTPYITDSKGNIVDDRLDPLYCWKQANNPDHSKRCDGVYKFANAKSWSLQVVTQIQAVGKDSSSSDLPLATTTYNYQLAITAINGCHPITGAGVPPQEADCVGDNWIPGYNGSRTPSPDQDWVDYYHAEFRGFNVVYTTSPAGNLTADHYFSTKGWGTPESDGSNYNAGALYEHDVYWGNSPNNGSLIQQTINYYAGTPINSCDGKLNPTYNACEVFPLRSRTTWYEAGGMQNSAPWVQTDYRYDDFNGGGLAAGYHNLLQKTTTSSNAPAIVQKWTYQTTDKNGSGGLYGPIYFYDVDKVLHSETVDSSGHVWQCQDNAYDEGRASGVPAPAEGLLTTTITHSDCGNSANTALTSYTGYDQYGNAVATVDAFGTANSGLYSHQGCTLATPPAYIATAWTTGHYTTCTAYDSYAAQPIDVQDALTHHTRTDYDYTQGALPTSTTDANGQETRTSYSYDSNGNRTVSVSLPGETGDYTSRASTNSGCTASSTLPCFEIDSISSQYPNAVKRTFYDSQGRAVETRTPLDASHDTIAFTVYNDGSDTMFQSVPFRVARGSNWIDPNGATDDSGATPGGNTSYKDPLGRVIGTQDPLLGSKTEPGVHCPGMQGSWTTCTQYGLGQAYGDSNNYDYAATHDANNHLTVSFSDALGRVRQQQWYSSAADVGKNITSFKQIQYNVLNLPTSVTMTDLTPQPGQTITKVTASATYDDLGRMTSLNDPDRGRHTYSYDADGRQLSDVSGSRTIGTSYDLLGRVGCMQDAAPPTDGSGSCSSGSHPLVQNSYDTSKLGTAGSTDFPVGQLTQSIATTYYPDGTSARTTEQFQHDQRGQMVTTTLQLGLPRQWNVSTAPPTYQQQIAYNDANQVTTTQTMIGGQAGYTFTQAYDSSTGMLTGLSNNGRGGANLVIQSYDTHGLVSDINFQTGAGTALATDHFTYDGDLRPASTTATWQQGSGSTATFFSDSQSYDAVGNVVSKTTTQGAVSGQSHSGGSETENFCYDEENRLVWAGNGGSQPAPGIGTCGNGKLSNNLNGAGYSAGYSYTHLGQLMQGPLNGTGTQQQYLYCDSNHPHQLTGIYPVGTTCSKATGASYGVKYDAWGNVISRTYNNVTATLSYDVLDHLVQWNAGKNGQEWYAYDSTGQRVLLRSISSSGTSMTVYAFGLEEHLYNGSGTNAGNTYYYMLGGRLIGERTNTGTQFFLTDALGSVLSTFNDVAGSATTLGNQVYGPYGNRSYSAGSMGTSKGFTGQYSDSLTGLDYYNARYYDPVVGLFISADVKQGNMQAMDPFAYVNGNPETMSDPTGEYIPSPGGGQCYPGHGCTDGGSSGDSSDSEDSGGRPVCNSIGCYGGNGELVVQRPVWERPVASGHANPKIELGVTGQKPLGFGYAQNAALTAMERFKEATLNIGVLAGILHLLALALTGGTIAALFSPLAELAPLAGVLAINVEELALAATYLATEADSLASMFSGELSMSKDDWWSNRSLVTGFFDQINGEITRAETNAEILVDGLTLLATRVPQLVDIMGGLWLGSVAVVGVNAKLFLPWSQQAEHDELHAMFGD